MATILLLFLTCFYSIHDKLSSSFYFSCTRSKEKEGSSLPNDVETAEDDNLILVHRNSSRIHYGCTSQKIILMNTKVCYLVLSLPFSKKCLTECIYSFMHMPMYVLYIGNKNDLILDAVLSLLYSK